MRTASTVGRKAAMSGSSTVSASAHVDAPPEEVFAFVCRPGNHPEISGDQSVKGERHGPEMLAAEGDQFGMRMKMYGLPYRITNTVVEFDPGRKIAWCHPGRHRWRWEVEPAEGGGATVTETFDLSPSPLKPVLRAMGYPGRHEDNVRRSVANVAAHFRR